MWHLVFVCVFVLVEFMDSERAHLKQELLQPEDEFSSLQTTALIVMPTSVLKAW